MSVSVGDFIKIDYVFGEHGYTGRTGTVTHIDDAGQLHGTWGRLAIIPDVDAFKVIERTCPMCGKRYSGISALSRKDNKTAICSECGMKEALDEYFG